MEHAETKNFGNLLTSEMEQLSFRIFMGLRVLYFVVTRSVQRDGFKVDRVMIIKGPKSDESSDSGCVPGPTTT